MKKADVQIRDLTEAEIAAVAGGYQRVEEAEQALNGYSYTEDVNSLGWENDFGDGGGDFYIIVNKTTSQFTGKVQSIAD